jgi:hypothetical protein
LQAVTDNTFDLGSAASGRPRDLNVARNAVVGGHLDTPGIKMRSGSADPTTSDLASGDYILWKNTTVPEVRLWLNDGGVMKKGAVLT